MPLNCKEIVESTCKNARNPRHMLDGFETWTLFKKIEIGVAGVVLLGSLMFFYWNWGFWTGNPISSTGGTIKSGTQLLPAGPLAPEPGNSSTVTPPVRNKVTFFLGEMGRLELVESAAGSATPGSPLGIRFYPSLTNHTWRPQLVRIGEISDPAKWYLAFVAANALEQRKILIPDAVGLTAEQITAEAATRKVLLDEIEAWERSVQDGSFEPKMSQQVFMLLEKYRALSPNDPQRDALASQIMSAGLTFATKLEESKAKTVSNYATSVYGLLQPPQQATLSKLAGDIMAGNSLPPAAQPTFPTTSPTSLPTTSRESSTSGGGGAGGGK